MNRFFNKKDIAFTLAEMMVVLALFSVVSAATLPVITAKQQIGNGEATAGSEGSAVDPWVVNSNNLSYTDSTMQANTSAVMVGGQVTDNARSLGYPQLIITDNYAQGSGNDDASHIILLKRNGSPYYAGRIMIGSRNDNNSPVTYGNVAMGANALNTTYIRANDVAIGSNAMAAKIDMRNNVAIGPNALTTDSANAANWNDVAIGNYAANGITALRMVLIGNYAGSMHPSATNNTLVSTDSVMIGDYAGYQRNFAGTRSDSVFIGTYSGYQRTGNNNSYIGNYAGANFNNSENTKRNSVAVGTYAGSGSTVDSGAIGGVAVGYYAGYNSRMRGTYLGSHAGMLESAEGSSVLIGEYSGYKINNETIAIGYYAAYNNPHVSTQRRVPVIIGHQARSMHKDVPSISGEVPSVVIGTMSGYYAGSMPYSILVGYYSGYSATNLSNAVCIGNGACAGNKNDGTNLVRISSKNGYYNRSGSGGVQSSIGDIPSSMSSSTAAYWNPSNYDNLLITPLYGTLSSSSSINSSVILFGDVFSSKTAFTVASDRRLKEHIRPSKYGLNEIRAINVYQYNWKDDASKKTQIGVIAQELQKIIPEGVHKMQNGYLTVSASWIVYPMVNAIKELDIQVQKIIKNVDSYTKEYISLAQKVHNLEKEVKLLEKENRTLTTEVKMAYRRAKMAESKR